MNARTCPDVSVETAAQIVTLARLIGSLRTLIRWSPDGIAPGEIDEARRICALEVAALQQVLAPFDLDAEACLDGLHALNPIGALVQGSRQVGAIGLACNVAAGSPLHAQLNRTLERHAECVYRYLRALGLDDRAVVALADDLLAASRARHGIAGQVLQ